jgi:hypothetical protein
MAGDQRSEDMLSPSLSRNPNRIRSSTIDRSTSKTRRLKEWTSDNQRIDDLIVVALHAEVNPNNLALGLFNCRGRKRSFLTA